jgi:3-hydroxyanthranilate 3,4-dioxygenase
MSLSRPLNFKKWIDDNRHLLKPPVGNRCVWEDREFIVMVVGGPNSRTDYHINQGEEFFYQVEGDMVLRVIEGGKPAEIPIKQGDIFLLPPRVPHSPQRGAGTVGLVIERRRAAGEKDGFAWYCEKCGGLLYSEFFEVTDLVKDLPPVFDRFYGSPGHLSCKKCGATMKGRDAKN